MVIEIKNPLEWINIYNYKFIEDELTVIAGANELLQLCCSEVREGENKSGA